MYPNATRILEVVISYECFDKEECLEKDLKGYPVYVPVCPLNPLHLGLYSPCLLQLFVHCYYWIISIVLSSL